MRTITLKVERSSDKLSEQKLKPSGKQITRAAGKFEVYEGNCIVAEQSDFESVDAIERLDAALVAALGSVKRDSEETGAKAGDSKGIVWCLNNGGLRLAFNDRILEPYRVAGSNSDAADGQAIGWASTEAPEFLADLATKGVKLVAAAIRKYAEDNGLTIE